jgi:hypothetical protein
MVSSFPLDFARESSDMLLAVAVRGRGSGFAASVMLWLMAVGCLLYRFTLCDDMSLVAGCVAFCDYIFAVVAEAAVTTIMQLAAVQLLKMQSNCCRAPAAGSL